MEGTEPSIIDQLSDMILDAERLERGKQRQLSHPLPQTFGVSSSTTPNMAEELMAMEMENYRLQKELLLLENSNRKDSNSNPGIFLIYLVFPLYTQYFPCIFSISLVLYPVFPLYI